MKQSDVDTLFGERQPAARVLGVGLALGNAALASNDLYRVSIGQSNSANEQYQGLRLAERNWSSLDDDFKAELVALIEGDKWIPGDPDREEIAERIIDQWSAESGEGRPDDPPPTVPTKNHPMVEEVEAHDRRGAVSTAVR